MQFRFYFLLQDNPASIWEPKWWWWWTLVSTASYMSSLVYGVGHWYLFFQRWLPGLTAARVDSRPRWQPSALTAARDVCPIRKRALGVPSARVKFLAPRRAKNRPLFLKKGKLGKNIVFLEVKNATMWIDVCQPSLGESFGWKLPNCNAGYQFL